MVRFVGSWKQFKEFLKKQEVKMGKEYKDQGYYKKQDGLYYKSITSLATDKEIHDLWEIIGTILDRNNIDDSGELSIRLI